MWRSGWEHGRYLFYYIVFIAMWIKISRSAIIITWWWWVSSRRSPVVVVVVVWSVVVVVWRLRVR